MKNFAGVGLFGVWGFCFEGRYLVFLVKRKRWDIRIGGKVGWAIFCVIFAYFGGMHMCLSLKLEISRAGMARGGLWVFLRGVKYFFQSYENGRCVYYK